MSISTEDLEVEIQRKLLALEVNKLYEVAADLNIDSSLYEGQSKRIVLRTIRKTIEILVDSATDDAETQENVKVALTNVNTVLESMVLVGNIINDAANDDNQNDDKTSAVKDDQNKESESSNASDNDKLGDLKQVFTPSFNQAGKDDYSQKMMNNATIKNEELKDGVKKKETSGIQDKQGMENFLRGLSGSRTSLFRKEWKMKGLIGDPNANQKDRLSFTSVKHQILEARKQGYLEEEIVAGVIRAMHSSLRLKSVLEMKSDLDLLTLMGHLTRHFNEKSTPDLCAQLTAATQMSNESVIDFILRCIELREKLVLSSKTSGEIEYNEALVQKLFLRTLERGLESSAVLQELRPLLKSKTVLDEDLLTAAQKAAMDEKERRLNLIRRQNPKIHSIEKDTSHLLMQQSDSLQLATALSKLTEQVSQLQSEVTQLRKGKEPYRRATQAKTPRSCQPCRQSNLENCKHCFTCGKLGHRSTQCYKKSDLPPTTVTGNAKQLLPRDNQ